MSDRPDPEKRSALDDLRDELGGQFTRQAARRKNGPRRWRGVAVAALAVLALTPGAVALAGGFNGKVDTHTVYVNGNVVKVDGRTIDCPASLQVLGRLDKLDKVGGDPCRGVTTPTLAPALSPGGSCPEWVKAFLRAAKTGETKLSDYSELPGYPFAKCPKEKQLRPILENDRGPSR